MDIFLDVKNVTKRFENHVALNNVSLSVRKGRIFGLLGPNGAGKTTLIRILNRITAPDSGEVIFDGRPMEPDDVMRIGYLPEERGLYRKMKVGEQAVYLARLKGLSKEEAVTRLRAWFDKFGIMPWWNRKLEELSKGMAQKVQFIITVLHNPDLLIFDEPFSGFDPVNAEQLKQEILQLKEQGHTIIFSTHNMASVEEICDDIALINHSEVVLQGEMRQIKDRFRTGLYELNTPQTLAEKEQDAFSVVAHDTRLGMEHYLLQAKEGVTGNELVKQLCGQVEIHSFAEQIPSMNDIFLKVIGKDTKWNEEQIESKS
jgi:ABC-2 type transport system ATP-binding protein